MLFHRDVIASRARAETRFVEVYDDHWSAILAYALRRTERPEDAADLVAETFLVAWRRRADVPPGPEARIWLYAVARRVLANHRRGERRRARLSERLRADLATATPCELATRPEPAALKALSRLDEKHREVLLLAGWEELEPAEIASVLGLSSATVRGRLHRARRRFRMELEGGAEDARSAAALGAEKA
jgi:RNA polymerase sigma factor (sigma-70 family)